MKKPKIARLECRTVDGDWICAGISESLVPIQALAAQVRQSGEVEGIRVDRGVVSATWVQSCKVFDCVPAAGQADGDKKTGDKPAPRSRKAKG
jgi:hypothetical protein